MTFLIRTTISILLAAQALAGHVPASEEKNNTNPFFIGRAFKNINDQHKLVATAFIRKDDSRTIKGLEASLRRKVNKETYYGIESDITIGNRHDDNWEQNDSGDWYWSNKSSDVELGSSLFLKFKRQLRLLPGKTWVGELNFKTHNNWTKTLLTLKPEASLTYIHFEEGKPIYNLFTKLKFYIPLNYSNEDIYAKWIYIGTLYHYTKNLKPTFFFATKKETWTNSKDFDKIHPGENYTQKSTLSYIGLGLNYYF